MTRRTCGCLALWLSLGLQLRAERFLYPAQVVEIEDLTPDTKRVRFRLVNAQGFHFTPGQYTFLKVPEEYVRQWNERYRTTPGEVSRPYSLDRKSVV